MGTNSQPIKGAALKAAKPTTIDSVCSSELTGSGRQVDDVTQIGRRGFRVEKDSRADILWCHNNTTNNDQNYIIYTISHSYSSKSDSKCHLNRFELLDGPIRRQRPRQSGLASTKISSPPPSICIQLPPINLFILFTLIIASIHTSYQYLLTPDSSGRSAWFVGASTRTTVSHLHWDFDDPLSSSFGLRRQSHPFSSGPQSRNEPQLVASSDSRSKFRYQQQTGRLARPMAESGPQTDVGSISSSSQNNGNQDKESSSTRIASLFSQFSELKRQLELELSLERRQVTLGSPCSSATDCSRYIERSHCKLDNFTCACLPQHVQFNSTTCLPPSLLGYECLIDAQCQRKVPGSYCSPAGICTCHSEFVTYRKDRCLPASKINDYCLNDSQCQLADRHSHCKWKIYNVYGLCNCSPNYKHITVNDDNAPNRTNKSTSLNLPDHQHLQKNTTSSTRQRIRCAPRLGDSCFHTDECQLATQNSLCREPTASDTLPTSWRSSGASSRKCYCAQGFVESANRLECHHQPNQRGHTTPGANLLVETRNSSSSSAMGSSRATTPAAVLALSAPNSMNAKHHYDLVIATNQTMEQQHLNSQGFDTKPLDLAISASSLATSSSKSDPGPWPTTQMEATTTTNEHQQINRQPPASGNSGTTKGESGQHNKSPPPPKASSLGKPCSSKLDCQIRDKHSDCINGLCECIRPTSKCGANSTGCHKDTFQCRNGQCISWYFVCDQFKNCDDGSDEDECKTHQCPPEAFQCDNGACLARGKLCNGKRECSDGSDERLCNSPVTTTTTTTTTWGVTKPANGTPTLSLDGGDSAASSSGSSCHPRAFACDNGQCLPAYVFCNAVEDCTDGSDENEPLCERVWPKRKWQPLVTGPSTGASTNRSTATMQTADSGSRSSQVGGQPLDSPLVKSDRLAMEKLLAAALAGRTPDGRGRRRRLSMEQPTNRGIVEHRRSPQQAATIDHRSFQCPRSAFTCRNGKCRSSAILCSGVDGCGDNSDEDRCEVCQCAAP